MKRMCLAMIVLLGLLMPAATVSAATTYYVRTDGDDGNDGLTDDASGAWLTIQHAIDNVAPGDTIQVSSGTYAGGLVFAPSQTGIALVGESGVIINGGAPGVDIQADNIKLEGLVIHGQGTHPNDSGILVADGVRSLWIERLWVRDWGQDGITTLGALTGFKLVDCVLVYNDSDGIELAVTPDGVVNIYGNAFRWNGQYGINNLDPAPPADLNAEYNEWGNLDGPAAVGGVSSGVDADPWVSAGFWVDPSAQTVREGEPFTATIMVSSHHLYGFELDMTVDTGLFQMTADPVYGAFETTTEGAAFETNGMAGVNSTGRLETLAYRALPDAEYDAVDEPLINLEFQANEIAGSSETGDISPDYYGIRVGAIGGINIWIYRFEGAEITVLGTTTTDGLVDLQGRADESGAVIDAAPGVTYGWDAAADTSGAWGDYDLGDLTDDTYDVTIEMDRYLDASAAVTVAGDAQILGDCQLLGGDANDDDVIDIGDVSIIGGQYGLAGASISDPRADINGSDEIDILDMVLAAGNYGLTESPWTP